MVHDLTLADGTALSRLAFGTMQFGGRADAAASRAMYDACRAAGLTHFDTACGYTDGASETLLGGFAAAERERVYIATKVGYSGGAGRANIAMQLDGSRSRLRSDRIDLLYLHRFDPDTPLEETFGTMADLQARGVIRHIGVSNYAAWQVMKAKAVCARLGTRIDAIQPMFSLVKRQAEVELLPMATDQRIGVFSYSPLGGGLLTGKYQAGTPGRLTEDMRYAARYGAPVMHETAAALARLGREIGTDPATLAVAWVLAHPARPCPIISARSASQLAASLAAQDFQMSSGLQARLTALSPSPPPATDRTEET